MLQETFTLSNGVEIPKLGLGTWMIGNGEVSAAVQEAIKRGYRHIDTAQAYQNEAGVAQGVRDSGAKRDELFITSKLAAEAKSYKDAAAAIDESLRKMELDYLDLMLIHSPQPWMEYGEADRFQEGNREAWRAMEEAYKAGKLRSIGVSNFIESDLENILGSASVKPMVNQILVHISNTPLELIKFNQDREILVEAYSPIAHGELLKNEKVTEMAERYGVSVPQLGIRYDLQLGLLPLPKTANPSHMESNAKIEFEISSEDMEFLKNIEPIQHYGEASNMPVFGGKLK
ncbi:MAG: 2,5-diketo-D-gluconic acid reductase [Leptospiraceae bacterium]|nr:2,5-diketo-D-gluconic acid reductase [Leptospiraceae bacterium]